MQKKGVVVNQAVEIPIEVENPTNCPISFSNATLDYAGYIFKYNEVIDKTSWLIDSGVSSHICFNQYLFIILKPISTKSVIVLLDGTQCLLKLSGSVQITQSIIIEDVLFILTFKFNLLSVSSLL